MKDLFQYLDYQKYLEDFLEDAKTARSWFSIRYFAQKIGMDHGNLVKVLKGDRHVSKAVAERIITTLPLDEKQAEYFMALVDFNKAKRPQDTKACFEKLMALLSADVKALEPHQYEFYRRWYHTAIYNVLDHYAFSGDYTALAARLSPPISAIQAKDSIELLLRLGLVRKDQNGRFVQVQKMITTGDSWRSIAIQSFQEETIKIALGALEQQSRAVRDFSTLTMSIGKEDLDKVREAIKEFRKNVIQIVHDSTVSDAVYQLNIQMFPMTKTEWGKK